MNFAHIIQGEDGDQYGDQVTKLFPVGQKMELPDGRIFRYALNTGATGVANNLYESSAVVANWNTQALSVALAIGDKMINQTQGAAVTDADEGSVVLEETSDLGHIYFVDHLQPATGTNSPLFFKPGVLAQAAVAVIGGNVSTFIKNPWQDIVISASPPAQIPVGIMCSIIVDGDWGWVQTMGVCSCLIDDTNVATVLGNCVRPSEGVDGAVAAQDYTEADDADHGTIGRCIEKAPDADFGLVYLRME